MKDEEKEKELLSLLAVRRPEAFWLGRKNAIIAAAGKHTVPRAWLLAPAAAAAAVLVMFLARVQPPAPAMAPETLVSTAFLENLDLLDDMDVLEAVPENEL